MQPWMPAQLLGSVGLDQNNLNTVHIRYISPQSDGGLMIVILSMPLKLFQTGEHQMHGFETHGIVARVNSQSTSDIELIGMIGDGFIQLDMASTEEGGAVSGSFEGKLLQLRPL